MGLMDKVKKQAEQALTKAQQGVSQGKAKIDQAQAKHQWDALLRNLGAAVYAQEREGGPSDAVQAALVALDEHMTAHGDVLTPQARSADGGTDFGDGATDPDDMASEDARSDAADEDVNGGATDEPAAVAPQGAAPSEE